MELELSSDAEHIHIPHFGFLRKKVPAYRLFKGKINEQVPYLLKGSGSPEYGTDLPRRLMSVADIIERKMTAPGDVREEWTGESFDSGDAVLVRTKPYFRVPKKELLFVHDSEKIRGVTPFGTKWRKRNASVERYGRQSGLYCLEVDSELFDELRDQDGTLYFSPESYRNIHHKGWVKKNGIFVPETKEVGELWDFLNRGRVDLAEYAELVYSVVEGKRKASGSPSEAIESVMWNSFDFMPPQDSKPAVLRPVGVGTSVIYGSEVHNVSLVGVAPQVLAHQSIESRSLEQGGRLSLGQQGALSVTDSNLEERVEEPSSWWERLKWW